MSDGRLRAAGILLAAAGLAIATYLTWVHYADAATVCVGGGGSCERVQSSDYAELGGVPVAAAGVAGYLAILAAFVARSDRARLAAAFLTIGGLGFTIYLTYLELIVIDAVCQWCVASAVVMTGLTAVAVLRYLRAPPEPSPGA